MHRQITPLALCRDAFLAILICCVVLSNLAQARMIGQGMQGHATSAFAFSCLDETGDPAKPPLSDRHCDSCVLGIGGAPLPAAVPVLVSPPAVAPAVLSAQSRIIPAPFWHSMRSRGPPATA